MSALQQSQPRPDVLRRERAALLVIDVQEAFRGYAHFERIAGRCAVLLQAARILGMRVLVSEQYPRGLGHTVAQVALDGQAVLEKVAFSAVRADGFDLCGRDQVIVAGIEAHVCVAQSALDLLASGLSVHVAADAVGSRHDCDYERSLVRLERAGAIVSTVEAILFELLARAGTPEFKAIQRLIV